VNPPPLPGQPNLRVAKAANVFLPGAGLYLLGHRRSGGILAGLFLLCFLAVLALFVVGYSNYLSAAFDPDLLKPGKLEQIGEGFHQGWLLSLAAIGGVIYATATVLFNRARRRFESTT